MANIRAIEACNVSWVNEDNAKREFFQMMENARKEMAINLENEGIIEMENLESGIEDIEIVAPVQEKERDGLELSAEEVLERYIANNPSPVEHDMDETGEETGEEYNPFGEVKEEEEEGEEEGEEEEKLDMSNGQNDPLAPYADELLNICFKVSEGVQVDFVQRKGSEVYKALDVLFAQQKGKFKLTIQRIVETDEGTEYIDIMTKAPIGQKSAYKGASAGKSTKGKTPEQIAEEERKRKEKEEERKRKEEAKARKAELRANEKKAEELQAALKAARNAPDEEHKDGTPNKSYLVFTMLHRPQGATYHELGDATDTVNGGWKTTIRKFATTYNKAVLTMYRTCEAKGGIKPYAAYKLIDNNSEALGAIPQGWVIDPSV